MRPIGGFFELETPRGGAAPHARAIALTSGRACLSLALRHLRPRRALVPFYACDTLLQPLAARGVAVERYGLTADLDPDFRAAPAGDACVIYINYFGLKGAAARSVAKTFGARAIIDDTQAFFAEGYPGAWSFNSARKFLGVPDGAYLYAPFPIDDAFEPNGDIHYDHLVNRLLQRYDLAFTQYQESEAHVNSEVRGMSRLAARLLRAVDYREVAAARRRNFGALHARLGGGNRLAACVTDDASAVPFCYPLLPERAAPRQRLWDAGLFVPVLWPEVAAASERRFAFERDLAGRLLPLPVDHRYDEADMARLAAGVDEVLH